MVNIVQAWAEAYRNVDPSTSVEVSGGGSGIGFAALINGTCDIAASSRRLLPEEMKRMKATYGSEPREFIVGYDALCIYVHPTNPINEISLQQLGEIYREGGKIDKWSDLGVRLAKGNNIVRVSRQNNSGNYHFFREVVIGMGRDFKLGTRDMNSSKDVIELVARTPTALGYASLGYAMEQVKVLKLSRTEAERAVAPSSRTIVNGTYPLAHPMMFYTRSSPPNDVQRFVQWTMSAAGQEIVERNGYGPLPQAQTLSHSSNVPGSLRQDSINGTVSLRGTPPPELQIPMRNMCGELNPGATTRHYVISPQGGLANVVVYIKTGLEHASFPIPREPVVIDSVACLFEPYVSVAQVGQKIRFRNLDPFMHNVHATPKKNREFNFAMVAQGQVNDRKFDNPELFIRLKGDVYEWIFAYLTILNHPFAAVTDAEGNYKLPAGLPPGTYTVAAHHLKAGEVTQQITMGPSEAKSLDFVLEVPARLGSL
jgi:phosphate transport system substrate-binding protein